MNPDKDWVDILTALMTPTVAIIGSLIAYQQWRINKLRLRHELYDRRMGVYRKLMDFLGSILVHASFDSASYAEWLKASYEGYFLFDEGMVGYFDTLNEKSRAFRRVCREKETKAGKLDDDKWRELCDKDELLQEWFEKQFDIAKGRFGQFLRIDT